MRFAFIALISLILSGCNIDTTPSARLGAADQMSNALLFLADNMGFLQQSDVRVVKLPSTSEVIHQLRNGNLEAAAMSLNEALQLVTEGVPLTVFLVTGQPTGLDGVVAQRGTPKFADLKSRIIGMENTALTVNSLSTIARLANLRSTNFSVRHVTLDEHIHSLAAKEVMGLVTSEPVLTQLQQQNYPVLQRIDYKQMEFINVLVVRNDMISEHSDHLTLITDAYFKALQTFQQRESDALRIIARHFDLDTSLTRNILDGLGSFTLQQNFEYLAGEEPIFQQIISNKLTVLSNLGFSRSNPSVFLEYRSDWLPSV